MRRILSSSFFVTAGLCFSLSSSAAVFTGTTHVEVPNYAGGFDVGLTGAYMEANYHHVGLVLLDTTTVNNSQPDGRFIDIDDDYDFAWGAMLGYRFAGTGNDVRFNYYHIDTDDSKNVTRQNGQILWSTVGNADDTDYIRRVERAKGKNDFCSQGFDFEFAQNVCVGCHTMMRFFTGISYQEVEKKTSIYYEGQIVNGGYNDTGRRQITQLNSDFKGFGPRVGVDCSYAFKCGFGISSHLGTSILIGDVDSVSRVTRLDIADESTRFTMKDRSMVVPSLDLRVAADYTHCFGCTTADLEVGYWARTYFGSVNNTHMFDHPGHTNRIDQLDNVTFHGAYLTLKAHF